MNLSVWCGDAAVVVLEEATWTAPAPRRPEEGGDPDIREQEVVEGGHEASVLPRLGQGQSQGVSSRQSTALWAPVLMETTSLG